MKPLTAEEIEILRQRLAERRQVLLAEVAEQLAQSDDPRATSLRDALAATEDWVLADILSDLDVAMVTRDTAELHEVDAALTSIAEGSYGTCRDCGEPVGWPRLNANPTALRCIACQEKYEKSHAKM
ncbi:MAG TPA: TraR/DksA family transcriptional regulator [Casimicrobiaceae bacterium]|jgi:RNA polymerase-binding protein DksA|nr:TraR/DksA family transcriptional regulator [Casimicrobiaceae bacterium]